MILDRSRHGKLLGKLMDMLRSNPRGDNIGGGGAGRRDVGERAVLGGRIMLGRGPGGRDVDGDGFLGVSVDGQAFDAIGGEGGGGIEGVFVFLIFCELVFAVG